MVRKLPEEEAGGTCLAPRRAGGVLTRKLAIEHQCLFHWVYAAERR